MNNYQDNNTLLLIFFAIFLLLISAIILYFKVIYPFLDERKYIKMELNRSSGEEYLYWKKQLKKLYLTQIPLIGYFIKKYF